jgi:hypothetical protein
MTEEQLFLDAIKIPEADRSNFLLQACGGNSRLQQKVEKLLRIHESGVLLIDDPCRVFGSLPRWILEYMRYRN